MTKMMVIGAHCSLVKGYALTSGANILLALEIASTYHDNDATALFLA